MDIWLIYVIKTLLLPLSAFLLFVFFLYLKFFRHKIKQASALLFSIIILYLISTPIVAYYLAKQVSPYSTPDTQQISAAQALVVIGGGLVNHAPEYGAGSSVNSRTLTRLRYTAKLAKQTRLPILVSGGIVLSKQPQSEAELMADILEKEFSVPVKWQETNSRNTAENARNSYRILSQAGIKHIVLVTHAIHMSRATRQFQQAGFTVIPAPTAFLSKPEMGILTFLPSVFALETTTLAFHEYLGSLWYQLRY